MKLALFALLSAFAHAAPTKRQDTAEDDGVISLDLTFNSPPLVDDLPEIIHKAAQVPHNVPYGSPPPPLTPGSPTGRAS